MWKWNCQTYTFVHCSAQLLLTTDNILGTMLALEIDVIQYSLHLYGTHGPVYIDNNSVMISIVSSSPKNSSC